jgi:hypothetical protein
MDLRNELHEETYWQASRSMSATTSSSPSVLLSAIIFPCGSTTMDPAMSSNLPSSHPQRAAVIQNTTEKVIGRWFFGFITALSGTQILTGIGIRMSLNDNWYRVGWLQTNDDEQYKWNLCNARL